MSSILNRFTEPTDTRDLTNQLNRLVSRLNEQFANVATQQNATAAAVAAKSKTTPTASLGPGTPTPQGSLEDPINLTATVTHKQDLLLQWAYPTTLPRDFAHFQVRVGTSWDAGTLVHDTKHMELLITDPVPGTNLYWVGIYNRAGSTDDDPPSVSATLPALPDVTGFSAVVTTHNDILLAWTKISPLPHGFDAYELRSGGVGISTATESGTTATITTAAAHGYSVGQVVSVGAVSVGGYNTNDAVVLTVPSSTTFTYTTVSGLGSGTGGFTIGWVTATFVDRTKKANYLIVDPPNMNLAFMIGVLDKAGNYDPTPPSAGAYFTQQPYTKKTLLSADNGPFSGSTVIIGPINFVIPPSGGRLHVDWTMLLSNGATAQSVEGYVADTTNNLNTAMHRTHIGASAVHGFNGSGHFDRLYPGGSTITLELICIPDGAANLTVNAVGTYAAKSFLDIQFHPSPN